MQHSKPDSDKTPVVVVQRAAAASSRPLGFKGHFLLPAPPTNHPKSLFLLYRVQKLEHQAEKTGFCIQAITKQTHGIHGFQQGVAAEDIAGWRPRRQAANQRLLWFCLLITIMDTHTQPDNRSSSSSSRRPLQQPLGGTMGKHLSHGQFSLHNTTDSKRPSLGLKVPLLSSNQRLLRPSSASCLVNKPRPVRASGLLGCS